MLGHLQSLDVAYLQSYSVVGPALKDLISHYWPMVTMSLWIVRLESCSPQQTFTDRTMLSHSILTTIGMPSKFDVATATSPPFEKCKASALLNDRHINGHLKDLPLD